MDLNTHIQAVRKLKPFLDAAVALGELADKMQGAQGHLASVEKDLATARAETVSAIASAGKAKIDAAEIIAQANVEAAGIRKSTEALLADARVKAARIAFNADAEASDKIATAQRQLMEKQAMLASVTKTLSEKAGEIAALDGRIFAAREAMRKLLE